MSLLYLILESMRPRQWLKNGLIFMAIIFSRNLFEPHALINTIGAFGIFCMVSGSVYIINDAADIHRDREHPLKSQRPIPSGRLSIASAWAAAVIIGVTSLLLAFLINPSFGVITISYFILFNLYSFFLKTIAIIDILTIALGFVIRAAAGALAIEVEISPWLLLCTMLLALFVVLGKRRYEFVMLGERADLFRKVLHEYNTIFLDQMIAVVTASTLVAYSFYTISEETIRKLGTKNMEYTIPFVIYGIFRYLYIIYRKEAGGRPEKDILTDIPTILNLFLWGLTVVIILYR